MLKKYVGGFLLACLLVLAIPDSVYAAYSLAGSNSFTGGVGVSTPITNLQITGSGDEPIPVKLYVTSGTLAMSTTTGLTFTGPTTGSVLYFSGSLANVNAALATLTYTRGSAGSDTLEVSLVPQGEVFFPDNNHLYKFISGTITANNARTAALAQSLYGSSGYLATITSEEENDFISDRLLGDGWMGASDAGTEGDWKWLDGPESGLSFWSGASGGSPVGGRYSNWSTGEPNDYNNGVPGEDCAQLYRATGMWNDLPCSSSTLGGYVVEFGAPGDLPTVVAKDISLNTVNAPVTTSLTPTDGATGVTIDANLTIQFSQTVTIGTGSITIKNGSDDTTVETIDVTGDAVTGGGTNTITINPSTSLSESTNYYVQISNTAFKNGSDVNYAGISNTTTWNFSTGDFTDPAVTNLAAGSLGDTQATITWETDEQTSSRVLFGLTSALGKQTAETDTSPRVTEHSVTLSSLKACAKYYYAVTSKDAADNSVTSSTQSFVTTGCEASSIERSQEAAITTSGGTLTLSHSSSTNTLTIPNGFYGEGADFQMHTLDTNNLPTTANNLFLVDNNFLEFLAMTSDDEEITTFDETITFVYEYDESLESIFIPATIALYKYSAGSWTQQNCTVNIVANTLTCSLSGFSTYAILGQHLSSSGSSSRSSGNRSSNSGCSELPLVGEAPNLFRIDRLGESAELYFSPLLQTATYVISYATSPHAEEHGAMVELGSLGVQSFKIHDLLPSEEYYFKVRGQRGCAAGDWSNIRFDAM